MWDPWDRHCVRHRPDDNHRSCQIHKDKNTNKGGFNGDNVRLMTATALSKGGWAGLKVALRPIRRVIWAGGSPSDFRWWQLRSPSDNHGLLKGEVTVRLWLSENHRDFKNDHLGQFSWHGRRDQTDSQETCQLFQDLDTVKIQWTYSWCISGQRKLDPRNLFHKRAFD